MHNMVRKSYILYYEICFVPIDFLYIVIHMISYQDLNYVYLLVVLLFHIDGCSADTTSVPALALPLLDFYLHWPETLVGVVAGVQCPCDLAPMLRTATRHCDGDYVIGAMWEKPLDESCNFTNVARRLCQMPEVLIPFMF